MMKYLLIILMLTSVAYCDFSLTAKEAMERTNKVLKNEKNQCVKDWEHEIEEQINLTVDIGACYHLFFVPECVSDNFLENALRNLKKLDYSIRRLATDDRSVNVSWCRK